MNMNVDHPTGSDATTELELVSVLKGHALWAESYDETKNPLLALEERIMEALFPRLGSAFVVDVACGTGRWLKKLLAVGARGGLGVDLSPEMLAQASRHPNLQGKLLRGDATSLPLPDGTADLVICAFAIGYVQDLASFTAELVRVARHGACLWISDFHPDGYAQGWKRSFRHGNHIFEIGSYHRSVAEIRKHFGNAGLRVVRSIDGFIGEPERQFFERAGKLREFQDVCRTPAVWITEFRRDSPITGRRS